MCCVPSFFQIRHVIQSKMTHAPSAHSIISLTRSVSLVVAIPRRRRRRCTSTTCMSERAAAARRRGRERRRRRRSAAAARSTCWPSICQYALSSPPRLLGCRRGHYSNDEARASSQPASASAGERAGERERARSIGETYEVALFRGVARAGGGGGGVGDGSDRGDRARTPPTFLPPLAFNPSRIIMRAALSSPLLSSPATLDESTAARSINHLCCTSPHSSRSVALPLN